MNQAKKEISSFWNKIPCGMREFTHLPEGSKEVFDSIEKKRYTSDYFMFDIIPFHKYSGLKILEVGCGIGIDLLQFARHGAIVYGVDFSSKSLKLAKKRFSYYGIDGDFLEADAESLPFPDNTFDFVYSWGVIHHTPNTGQAAREIIRVCKPGGNIFVMLYHKNSLVALQAYMLYGVFHGKPFTSIDEILANHLESPGTKAFTRKAAQELFEGLLSQEIRTIVTRYDLRVTRNIFLPRWCRCFVPSQLGWFMIIEGQK